MRWLLWALVSGCGGLTTGEACALLNGADCARDERCGRNNDPSCEADALAACCGDAGVCDRPSAHEPDAVAACVEAIEAQSCTEGPSVAPPACVAL